MDMMCLEISDRDYLKKNKIYLIPNKIQNFKNI